MKLILSIFCLFLFYTFSFAKASLNQMISQMMLVEFKGKKPKDLQVIKVKNDLENGEIGGVVILKENIALKAGLRDLIKFIKGDNNNIFIALNNELTLLKDDGFSQFENYRTIANEYDLKEAKAYYEKMSKELKSVGINYLFAPHVNRGEFEQIDTFSKQTNIISTYANIFISSFEKYGVLTGIKFFPTDKNSTWDYESLRPFYDLIKAKKAKSVILSCYYVKDFGQNTPSCMSKKIINSILIKEFQYSGIIVADLRNLTGKDLKNGAIKAINAGVNMLILADYPSSSQTIKKTLMQSIWDRVIDKEKIKYSYKKILEFKQMMF